jgi:NAD(P)H-hydrate repair Nnr-like enzyme with NAD(P)H-hydrate epimerase domain
VGAEGWYEGEELAEETMERLPSERRRRMRPETAVAAAAGGGGGGGDNITAAAAAVRASLAVTENTRTEKRSVFCSAKTPAHNRARKSPNPYT